MKLVLASKSPRRKEILERLGYEFIVDASNFEESEIREHDVKRLVMQIARGKAEKAAAKHKDSVIIAADTAVYFKEKIIGQPKDAEEAEKMIKSLLGEVHEVHTGLYLINTKSGKTAKSYEVSRVKLNRVSKEILTEYISAGSYEGKAGAYNISDPNFSSFVESVEGSYTNIMGLPLEQINSLLKQVE
ncbi:MAG: Maf family protein [Candidatus Woesearchaeota archaeon]